MHRVKRLLGALLAAALGAGFLPAFAGCGGASTVRARVPVVVDSDRPRRRPVRQRAVSG